MQSITADTRNALLSVSPTHQRFIEFASSEAAWLDRARFQIFDERHCAVSDPIQSWPTLVGEATRRQIERVSVGLCRLIKKLPGLIFDYDPVSISDYYSLDLEFIRHFVIASTTERVIEGAFGRGDFLLTSDRLWCLEFNIASNVGGLTEAAAWQKKLAALPIISEYLVGARVEGRFRNSLRYMMIHVREHATRYLVPAAGEVNVACALTKGRLPQDEETLALAAYFAEEYREVVNGVGGAGSFQLCGFEDLEFVGHTVFLGGKPIHSIVEMTAGDVPLHVLRRHQHGSFALHNGPVTYLLCNKLNMALLSEFEQNGPFDESERELIHNHVPWTRKVARDGAVFEGEQVDLPSFILENKNGLMLKKSISRSGFDVVAGSELTPAEWERALAHALYERDWIIQKYIPCPLLPYQHGGYGWQPHRAVWGAFVFGDTYGGTFLRLLPEGRGAVVAASKGASDGMVLEVA